MNIRLLPATVSVCLLAATASVEGAQTVKIGYMSTNAPSHTICAQAATWVRDKVSARTMPEFDYHGKLRISVGDVPACGDTSDAVEEMCGFENGPTSCKPEVTCSSALRDDHAQRYLGMTISAEKWAASIPSTTSSGDWTFRLRANPELGTTFPQDALAFASLFVESINWWSSPVLAKESESALCAMAGAESGVACDCGRRLRVGPVYLSGDPDRIEKILESLERGGRGDPGIIHIEPLRPNISDEELQEFLRELMK